MPFTNLNGVTLHYRDEGPKDAPTILFANSLGTDFRIWDNVCDGLLQAGSYRLIRYDKRGHGLSDAPPQPYVMSEHVDDAEALIVHLGVKTFTVVGLSVGGLIAHGLWQKRPEMIEAIVLSNTAHKIGTDKLWNERIDTINDKGISALAEPILARWFSKAYRTSKPDDLAGYRNMLIRTTVDGYCGTGAAIRDTDFTEVAKSISVPTLLIAGGEDGATPPELMRTTEALINGSQFELIEEAGHLPCVEAPDIVTNLIHEFISKNGRSGEAA